MTNYSLIPRYSNVQSHQVLPQLLMLQEEQGWTLPRHSLHEEAHINEWVREQFGLRTTVLYIAYDRYQGLHDDERVDEHFVFALENHSPDTQPRQGRWMSREDIRSVTLLVPEHRPVIEQWFDELAHGASEQRLPWMYSGWFDDAVTWIRTQATAHGYTLTGEVEQVKVRVWSAVMRVATDKGTLYFKAIPSFFTYEPPLTVLLSQYIPAHSPRILAVDEQRLWMLMLDAGTVVRQEHDIEKWQTILTLYAQFQIDLIPEVETLLTTECPDRRLAHLPELYEMLLTRTDLLLLDQARGLPQTEYEQLRAITPSIEQLCTQLASYHIPETLHQDDLHGGNILWNGTTYVFFDWSDCAITHPFLSLFTTLRVFRYVLEFDEETQQQLITAYLTPWTGFAPMERLRDAFMLAQRLGALSKALTWYRILNGLEPSMYEEYKDTVLYYLRVFLGTEE